MKRLQTLEVDGPLGRSRISLYFGNLMHVGEPNPIDILVASVLPGDYTPTPRSLVGSLLFRGVALSELVKDKAMEFGPLYDSWLSQDIGALGTGLRSRRILCVEDTDPNKLFRSLVAVLSTYAKAAVVAMPVIGTGDQGLPLRTMFLNILEAAVQWIRIGLPLAELQIVVRSAEEAREAERLFVDYVQGSLGRSARRDAAVADRDREFHLFLSYSHDDEAMAQSLVRALEGRRISVFVDRKDLLPGVIWQQELYRQLDECCRIVALLSPSYIASSMCIEEYNIAIIRGRAEGAEVLAPIYLRTATLPTYMKLRQWIDCRESDLAKLNAATANLA